MLNKIKPYIEKGLISEQIHPENSDIHIFNYTNKCQYDSAWDDVTMTCRGLIIDVSTGEKLSNPFPKFFNYEEYVANGWQIPGEEPIVTKKLDGWVGILYWLEGRPYIATRGSFESTGAKWATKWFRDNVPMVEAHRFYGKTLMFEIICPQTRIVLHYPEEAEGLYLLSVRSIETGYEDYEYDYGHLFSRPARIPADCFDKYNYLKSLDVKNEEGFVLYYLASNVRIKIKFEEYKRLHKIITGLSEIGIWESLRDGKDLTFENVPDEFYNWVKQTKERLRGKFAEINTQVVTDAASINLNQGRKSIAAIVSKMKYPGLVFSKIDRKNYDVAIWRMIKPKNII